MSDLVTKTDMTIWEFIRLERRHQKMSQSELAKRAGISRNYISLIERGGGDVTLKTLIAVIEALGYVLRIRFAKKANETKEFNP